MFDKIYCVYILSSQKNGTLYVGITNNLIKRIWEHKHKKVDGFTKKYMTGTIKGNIDRRVLFDNTVIFAIITKNRLGDPPTNCSDWPDDAVREAAEKHYGACSDNYCENILKYYREYR